jgi:co-chaperonin GroES (HSP10)
MNMNEPVASNEAELAWAFPSVDPGATPLGGRILVQLRRTKKKSQSGLILVSETKEAEKWQNMVAKVIAVGPLAFKHRDTMQSWPEGSWCNPGDFIRVPKWGGDRWEVPTEGDDEPSLFAIFNDHEVIAKVTTDPLAMRAFV